MREHTLPGFCFVFFSIHTKSRVINEVRKVTWSVAVENHKTLAYFENSVFRSARYQNDVEKKLIDDTSKAMQLRCYRVDRSVAVLRQYVNAVNVN